MPLQLAHRRVVPLSFQTHVEKGFADFPITRLGVTVLFEPGVARIPEFRTIHSGVIVDTGSPYCILSHDFHSQRPLRIHQELGFRPYRALSMTGRPLLQRMAIVGIKLMTTKPHLEYVPARFLPIKAYFLDANQRPGRGVVLGLDALRQHFRMQVEEQNSFLQVRSA